ncbi:MAG: DUF4360 domain-containing protein [Bdellovibrionota bacterium]
MKNQNIFSLSLLGVCLSSQVAFADNPDPSQIYMNTISYQGSGCEDGRVAYDISEDGQAMTILFDDYSVETGRNPLSQKDCTLILNMHIPEGWSFALFAIEYSGYTSLSRFNMAQLDSKYWFDGTIQTKLPAMKIHGPYVNDFIRSNQLNLNSNIAWSKCGGTNKNLNLKTKLSIKPNTGNRWNPNGTGNMMLDSVDGEIRSQLSLAWKKCSSNQLVDIYRLFNGKDRMFSLDPNEGSSLGYQSEGAKFALLSDQIPGTHAIYRCVNLLNGDHFLSKQANCEGARAEGILGYAKTDNAPGLRQLYRCYSPRLKDFASTAELQECHNNGYTVSQQLGWVK